MEDIQPLMNVQAYASPDEFMGQIKSLQYISQSLEELRANPTAIVYYGSPCCSVKFVVVFLIANVIGEIILLIIP